MEASLKLSGGITVDGPLEVTGAIVDSGEVRVSADVVLDVGADIDPNTEAHPARMKESRDDVDAQVQQREARGRPAFVTGLSLVAVGALACAAGSASGALLLRREAGEVLEQE